MTQPVTSRAGLSGGGRPAHGTGLPTFCPDRLRSAMKAAGLGENRLALQGELQRRFSLQLIVKRYLEGKQKPTLEVAWAIAQVLGKPIEFFLVVKRKAS